MDLIRYYILLPIQEIHITVGYYGGELGTSQKKTPLKINKIKKIYISSTTQTEPAHARFNMARLNWILIAMMTSCSHQKADLLLAYREAP